MGLCCFGSSETSVQKEGLAQGSSEVKPLEDRSCRDVLFAILFVLFWAGMLVIGFSAYKQGNPTRLLHGLDDRGHFCGEGRNEKFPYLYFPDITSISWRECVPECWSAEMLAGGVQNVTHQAELDLSNPSRVAHGTGDCQPRRKDSTLSQTEWIEKNWGVWDDSGTCIPGVTGEEDRYNPYESFAGKIKDYLSSMSASSNSTISNIVSESLTSGTATLNRLMGDVEASYLIIAAGAGVALIVGFIWLLLMRLFSKFFVWTTVFSMVIVCAGFTYFLYHEADKREKALTENSDNSDTSIAKALKYLSYVAAGVSFILLCVIIFMRKRIQITAEVIREASKAISSMPMIIFYPLVTFLLSTILMAYWIAIALYLASAGEIGPSDKCAADDTDCPYKQYIFNNDLKYAMLYHLFGLLWTFAFILALGEMVIAGAIANWYWADDKKHTGAFPVCRSFQQCLRYYLGTLALGSLIIAVIQMIRLLIEYIDRQSKKYTDNAVVKVVICCCRCCFWCLEKCMRFINRNAYIMVAVYGEGFCASAKSAFQLILSNAARVAAVNFFGDFLLFLGKIVVAGSAGVVAFIALDKYSQEELSSVFFPTALVVILAYAIGSAFMSVYEMAIDTILLCFCKDCEIHNNFPHYCSDALKEILGRHEADQL